MELRKMLETFYGYAVINMHNNNTNFAEKNYGASYGALMMYDAMTGNHELCSTLWAEYEIKFRKLIYEH